MLKPDFDSSPSLTMSMPASRWRRTISSTALSRRASSAAESTGLPSMPAQIISAAFQQGLRVIGYYENIQKLTREDVWTYYKRMYVPDRVVFAVVGDIDPEATLKVVKEQFADFAQWRFLANGAWQQDSKKVTPVFPHVGSEFSVSWLPGRKAYAAVYSEGIGGKILVRLAPALAGP